MNLFVFAPIVLIFIIMIMIVLVAKKVTVFKNMNIVFIVYVVVLVVFTAAYFIVPKSYVELDTVQYDGEAFDELFWKINADIENGKLDEVKEYIIGEQSYDYAGKELIIEKDLAMEDWLNIVIEIKDESDGVIEVTQFHTGAYVNDMDISGYIKPVRLELNEGHLLLQNPEQTYLNMTSFKKEFPMTQFDQNEEDLLGYSMSSGAGNKVLYIQIPKGLLVKNETGFNLQYVEK